MDLIDRLLEHDDWANRQLLELSRDLTDAQLDQEFDIGWRTLRDTFDHMIFNIAFWTGLMVGRPVAANRSDVEPYDRSMAGLIERYDQFYAEFKSVARQTRDEQRLDETFDDFWGERPMRAGAIVHLILHHAEHRTEVLHILQRLGVPDVPEIDHALWDLTERAAASQVR